MDKKVKVIPATRRRFTSEPIAAPRKRRVAGYARVSTDHEEQATSYEAQVRYYTEYIRGRDDWVFAGMYTDDGISATSTRHRDGFNQMVEDALAGKIDLIITKSVSRFARNTVDSLTTVRKLKDRGIEIYFEKENIWTLDAKGELLITIMSSLAQEESRSISENTTWGKRRGFAEGKTSVTYSRFLGYGPDFSVIEEEAETVRLIYRLYLSGLSSYAIARRLEEEGVKAPAGGSKWHADTIRSILRNEKYKGDALIQKTYTADFLTKKTVKNTGEVPQYYVEGHHEAIIDAETFELAQAELRRRAGATSYSGLSIFSSKIVCGECGAFYGPRVWHSNDKYRKNVWQCGHKYKRGGGVMCRTPALTEDEIKAAFLKALNGVLVDREAAISDMEVLRRTATDTSLLESELAGVESEIASLGERLDGLIRENARTARDQGEYGAMYDEIAGRYDERERRRGELEAEIADAKASGKAIGRLIRTLRGIEGDVVTEFDESLWSGMVESMEVGSDGGITVKFRGGMKVKV